MLPNGVLPLPRSRTFLCSYAAHARIAFLRAGSPALLPTNQPPPLAGVAYCAMQIIFHVHRHATYGCKLILLGSAPFVGSWNVSRAIDCKWTTGNIWKAQLEYNPSHAAPSRIEFKFAIARDGSSTPDIVEWEHSDNHAVSLPAVLPGVMQPAPILVETHWGAATELDLRRPPGPWRSQSPPPTPASVAALDGQDEEQIRRAVARLAVSRAENPSVSQNPAANGVSHSSTDTASSASNPHVGSTPGASSLSDLVPVQFRIKYRVEDGERIYVIGDIEELGKWNKMHAPRLAQPMSNRVVESGLWVLDMHLPRDKVHMQFEYKYFTRKRDGSRRWEGGGNRVARPFDDEAPINGGVVIWDDRWEKVRLDFSIYYPTKETEVMHVTGDPPEIGAWFKPGPTPMKLGAVQTLETDVKGRKWHLSVWVDPETAPFPYRYIIMDSQSNRSLWEREPNRRAEFDPEEPLINSVHIFRDVNFVSEMMFDRVPPNMFIGPYPQTVDDIDTLAKAGVTAIFNTQTDEDFVHRGIQWDLLMARYRSHDIKVVRYPIRDFDRISLRKRLVGASAELDELIRAGKDVYIHCTAGMGRAPACAVAYLCLVRQMPLDDAVTHVKKHRIVAVPNVPVLQDMLEAEQGQESQQSR